MNPRTFSPYRNLIAALILLFLLETAVMAFINYLQLPAAWEAIIDSSALMFLVMPVLYITFIRPMIRQYQAIERAHKTIETMYHTSLELAQSLDLNRVMDVLLKRINGLVPVDFAALYLGSRPGSLLHKVTRGFRRELDRSVPAALNPDLCDHPLIQEALTRRESRLIPDVAAVDGWPYQAGCPYGRSWMLIPLVLEGQAAGLYVFTRDEPDAFTPEHLRLAEGVVSQAALAVQNALLYEQVSSAREQLQILAHKGVMFHELERRYLAKALYDEVGQSVASVMVQAGLLRGKNAAPEAQPAMVEALVQELNAVSKKLHDLANDLRPASLDFLGLQAALSQYVDRLQEDHPTQIRFHPAGQVPRLPEATEAVLFRIAQEAVANAIRHARAGAIDVHLQADRERLVLIIEDDGAGFNQDEVDPKQCFGLFDMRERAEMVGGDYTLETSPGNGTLVRVSVPLSGG